MALKRETEAEKSEDQHSRDFWGCSIFDFCNNIGTFRTWRDVRLESVMRSILLQKSFCTGGPKFCGLSVRFSCKDLRDPVASR